MVSNLVGSNTKPKHNVSEPEFRQQRNTNSPYSNSNLQLPHWTYRIERPKTGFVYGSYVGLFLLAALGSLILLMPVLNRINSFSFLEINRNDVPCGTSCRIQLVETIPEGLEFDNHVNHISTADLWKGLILNATESIDIASFYWTLRSNKSFPTSDKGEEIFQELVMAGLHRNITVRIAQNEPSTFQPNPETEFLHRLGAAEVRSLNFTALVGAGVLHSKFWIIDKKHLYVGSANMDWRALTEVKEMGVAVLNCPCAAHDLRKIFEVYWSLGYTNTVPKNWPDRLTTKYNANSPMNIPVNNKTNLVYFSSSPPQFSPKGRNQDLDALLRTISNAKKYVYIAVMDYFPLSLYTNKNKFWPVIDNEIRRVVIDKGVNVRILISQWKSTRKMIFNFMNSLRSLNLFNNKVNVEVKKFKVPSTPEQNAIPYARVNHNKYMVTDNGVYIGTSNWSADYFSDTAGVSFVSTCNSSTDDTIRQELLNVFERDWSSKYAEYIY